VLVDDFFYLFFIRQAKDVVKALKKKVAAQEPNYLL
jgi:hypothetical protein